MLEKIYFSNNGDGLNYGTIYIADWDDSTFYFYLFLFLLTIFGGWLLKNSRAANKEKRNIILFWITFLFLYIICGFRGIEVGRDTEMYTDIYANSLDSNYSSVWNIEPGFLLLNKFFKFFLQYDKLGIPIFSFISLFLIYKTVFKMRTEVDTFFALLLFYAIGFYLQMFNLLRISLATTIELYFFYFVLEKKFFKYFVVLCICCTIHYSTLLMFVPFLSLVVYERSRKIFIFLLIALFIVAIYSISNLDKFIIFARYEHYSIEDLPKTGIGFAEFVYNIPLLLLVIYMYKKTIADKHILNTFFIYTIFCFAYGMVAYYLPVRRFVIHFLMIYILLIPYCIRQLTIHKDRLLKLIKLFFVIYALIRFHYFLLEGLYSHGIMPYYMAKFY